MNSEKSNVPQRRFKEFENNGAWEQRELGEVAEGFEYGLNAAAKEFDGKNKYLRITDIDDETNEFLKNDLTSPNIEFINQEKYILKKGDILFAIICTQCQGHSVFYFSKVWTLSFSRIPRLIR